MIRLSYSLLEASDLILIKKIISIRRHYDFMDRQGTKLGEAKGNIIQAPPKFRVIDNHGVEIMNLHGKVFSKQKYYAFYSSSGEEIGIMRAIFEKDDLQFLVERNGEQFMLIHRETSSKPLLEELVTLPNPDEFLQGLQEDYVMEIRGKTVAKVHRKWLTVRNQLELSIIGEVDHRLIIGAVIGIEDVVMEGK
jgi:uncharacterized protein YxjI